MTDYAAIAITDIIDLIKGWLNWGGYTMTTTLKDISDAGPVMLDDADITQSIRTFKYSKNAEDARRIVVDKKWRNQYIQTVTLSNGKKFQVHRGIAKALYAAIEEAEADGWRLNLYDTGAGGFVQRRIMWDATRNPSLHALGVAVDLNPTTVGLKGPQDARLIERMENHGFRMLQNDQMHFQPVGVWTITEKSGSAYVTGYGDDFAAFEVR